MHRDPGGFTPVVNYAEANTPGTTTAGTTTKVPFDAFWDVAFGSIPDLSAVALSYAAGDFTATADGLWLVRIDASINTTPGDTGLLILTLPTYSSGVPYTFAASGDDSNWGGFAPVPMHTGDAFWLDQFSPSAVTLTTYVSL